MIHPMLISLKLLPRGLLRWQGALVADGRCAAHICGRLRQHTVRPFLDSLASSSMSLRAFSLSRPVVGSSKKIALGSVTRPMPTETRLRSPPEMPAGS